MATTSPVYIVDHEHGGGAVYVATALELSGRGVRDMGMVNEWMAKRTPAIAGLRRFRLTRRELRRLRDDAAVSLEAADLAEMARDN